MELVSKLDEILQNTDTIDNYLTEDDKRDWAINLIKNGICFVIVNKGLGLFFYPSRFIGYKGNNMSAHIGNQRKDGRDTNLVISKIIGFEPSKSPELEMEYIRFCEKLGFTARKSGPFNVTRKYWLLS